MKYRIQVNQLILIICFIILRVKVTQKFIGFTVPLGSYKNIKDGSTTLEKVEENKKN